MNQVSSPVDKVLWSALSWPILQNFIFCFKIAMDLKVPLSFTASFMYSNQGMKQTGSYGGSSIYGSGQYGSGQTKQPSNQSFMSQAGSSNAGYVGYGSVRSQAGATGGGYSTTSQVVSGVGYSSASSQASSANNVPQKPRQVISKVS